MFKTLKSMLAIATVTAAVMVWRPVAVPAAAKDVCFKDWSAAAAAVKSHNLVPVDKLGALARRTSRSRLVKTELCRSGDGFIYRVVIQDARGRLKRLRLDAKRPFMTGSMTQ